MNRQLRRWYRGKEVTGRFLLLLTSSVKIPQSYSSLFFFTFLFSNGPLLPCCTKVVFCWVFFFRSIPTSPSTPPKLSLVTVGMLHLCPSFSLVLFFFYYYSLQWHAGPSWRAAVSQSFDLLVLESSGRPGMERLGQWVCVDWEVETVMDDLEKLRVRNSTPLWAIRVKEKKNKTTRHESASIWSINITVKG